MNILYLSHLSGVSYAGPTYSVPKQIEAQRKIDNVFWYNATKTTKKEWLELSYYHDLSEYPDESIYKLPEPFNRPDIIIVELFYNMARSRLRRELVDGEIPYIIIPRGELTKKAQMRKGIKKKIANILFCNEYAKKATAIQYLTEQEYNDSGDRWNQNHIVIPNGVELPIITKENFTQSGIKIISIGRIEPYQKGLDLLIDACSAIKENLIKSNCSITICGPDKEGKLQDLIAKVNADGLKDIIAFQDGVYGAKKEKALLESDVFIISSRFEGHPMALIEALSYGMPALVTTGANMRKEIEDYNAGWGADATVESIKQALLKLIDERLSFDTKGKNARHLAKKYAWDILAKGSREEYLRLLV